jgi:hypothetical protein
MDEIDYKWTTEVEELLEKLQINCVNLSEYHRKRVYHFKGYGKYFRVHLIILASINSTASTNGGGAGVGSIAFGSGTSGYGGNGGAAINSYIKGNG